MHNCVGLATILTRISVHSRAVQEQGAHERDIRLFTRICGEKGVEPVPLERFCQFVRPSPAELEAVADATTCRREFKRRQAITRQGDPVSEVYLLRHGWVTSSIEVDFNRRQLVKIHLPGDIAGLPSIALAHAAETLMAVSPASVDVIPLDRLGRLFERAPRLALALFVSSQQERIMLIDHLAAVAQTTAVQRVCALLLHVYRRLKLFGQCTDQLIRWPLSQEHMAQGAGLTAIHVNRTLRELRRNGIIAREGRSIRLLDLDRLSELAALPERAFVREPAWLTCVAETSAVPKAASTPL
jgi:CRP/FNR family transcriptional regulator